MKLLLLSLLTPPLAACAQATPPPQQHEQIDVSTTRSSVPIGESAHTTYTLSPHQLDDAPALTLDESLRQHAGFELFRRAPSRIANPTSEGISLRGLGSTAASRTLVLEDGAPLNDPFGGWIHWNETPQPAIDSVEIVTGGGSDLYGSSALGGVIDLTPKTPSPAPALLLEAAGGSEATSNPRALATATSRFADILLAGESLRTAGYIPTDPAVAGLVDTPANVRSQAFRAELGRRDDSPLRPGDPAHVFLTGDLLNEDRDNGTPLQTNATRLRRYLAGYDTPQSKPNGDLRLRLFGSNEGYRQTFSSIPASRNSETLTRLQRVHTGELGATLDATRRLGRFALVAGADARDIRGEDNETPIAAGQPNGLADVTARQRFVGGFAEVLAQAGPWSGAFSLRADDASLLDVVQSAQTGTVGTITRTLQPNRAELVLSPRLGLVRSVGGKATLHASAFRAFRAPTMNELYRTGQVGQQTTLANPALSSERATGVEAGVQAQAGRVDLQATYFWTGINRPVSAVLISQTATTMTNLRENLGQIQSQGVEASATIDAGHPVSLTLGYQFAHAIVTSFTAQPSLVGLWIPQVPRESFTAQLRAANERFGELTLAARASGQAFDDSSNQYPLAGFFELGLSGRRSLARNATNGPVEAFFLVQNLTNQRQQVSRTPILTLGTPIFAEAGLRLRLGPSTRP